MYQIHFSDIYEADNLSDVEHVGNIIEIETGQRGDISNVQRLRVKYEKVP